MARSRVEPPRPDPRDAEILAWIIKEFIALKTERETPISKLGGDEAGIIFSQLHNVLEPHVAMDFSSTSSGLWALTQALRQQLRVDHEVAAVLCRKMGMRSCKELREAKIVDRFRGGLSSADLATLGRLSPSVRRGSAF